MSPQNVKKPMGSAISETRPEVANFQVRRPDTSQFASVEGLTRMAGVGAHLLRRLIAKEVTDNALDEMDRPGGDPGSVTVRRDGDDTYIVEDEGSGISQNSDVLRDLFSQSRSMVSGKFLRRPSRGTLGNGLRVLVGAVALSGGTITVESHGSRTTLKPRRTGGTEVVEQIPVPLRRGTRITYTLDAIIPYDVDDLDAAEAAIDLAEASGEPYTRLSSPHWLDLDYLEDVFAAIEPEDITVRQLIERMDGCSGAKAGHIAAPFGKARICRSMREAEIAALLGSMQASARNVKPRSLGLIGGDAFGDEYDGYIVAEAGLIVGAHEPRALIPVLIEAWASVTSRRGRDAWLTIYCNRTPVVGDTYAVRGQGGIRLAGAGLDAFMEVDGGNCDLIVAVTSPYIPTTSLGKAPDLRVLEEAIGEALRRAFTRSRNRVLPDPEQPKPPKDEPPPKPPKPEPYQASGPLATRLAREAERAGVPPSDLLVLSPKHDPFNETKANRRDAEWFAEQVRCLKPEGEVHLRGMYYRCLAAKVRLPDGTEFEGTHTTAELVARAGKYARHFGLVAFDRIVDERAAPPELYLDDQDHDDATRDPIHRELMVSDGREPDESGPLTVPELDRLLPTLSISAPEVPRQRFRICMIGEKTSLGEVLRPIAREVHGELLLATGEVSESAVYGIASRAADDGRPLRILYFSDFDPAGWQMPISVARKLQAHICRKFQYLDVQVIRVGLNIEQVNEYDLPDSPIKPGEKRAQAWREKWGREQVEIDALAALRPEVLDRIARDAVAPYFDPAFERRYAEAMKMPQERLNWFLGQPAYEKATALVGKAYKLAVRAIASLNAAQVAAIDAMRHVVKTDQPDLPDVIVKPEIGDDEPEAVFDSDDDFVTATRRLQNLKALSADDEGEDE